MSSGIFKIVSGHSSPDAIHSERSERESVCVCECASVCVCESMRDGFVSPLLHFQPFGFLSFQIPFITLDGLFDAQQEGCVPLVQA